MFSDGASIEWQNLTLKKGKTIGMDARVFSILREKSYNGHEIFRN